MNKHILLFLYSLMMIVRATAQETYDEKVKKYIDQYAVMAMNEQTRSGIPACITLSQGIFESEAGNSDLATKANNHFGIKCKSDYKGEFVLHDDDIPNEKFIKYKSAEDSYRDHSDHLKRNPRYAPLFKLSITDYAAWAYGLKNCGYATNPNYGDRIIKIIEDFRLQEYTYATLAGRAPKPLALPKKVFANTDSLPKTATPAVADVAVRDTARKMAATLPQPPAPPAPVVVDTPKVVTTAPSTAPAPTPTTNQPEVNTSGVANRNETVHHIVVHEDNNTQSVPVNITAAAKTDTPGGITKAIVLDNKVDSNKVSMVNGLKAFFAQKGEILLQYAVKYNIRYTHLLDINDLTDAPIPAAMPIYLERKLTVGNKPKHTVAEGENLLIISQLEGIQLRKLQLYNQLQTGEEPAVGAQLELQTVVAQKPALRQYTSQQSANTNNEKKENPDDYIVIDKYNKTTATANAEQQKADSMSKVIAEQNQKLQSLKDKLDKVVYTDSPKATPKAELPATDDAAIKELPKLHMPVAYDAPEPRNKKKNNDHRSKHTEEAADTHNPKVHVVRKGENYYTIAKKYKIPVKQLVKWNDIDPDDLKPGQKLKLKP